MEEDVLPGAEAQAEAVAGETPKPVDAPADTPDGEQQKEAEQKAEKTPEQRAIERLERKLGRVIGQREEARAEREHLRKQIAALQPDSGSDTTGTAQAESDSVSLSRAELQKLIKDEAQRLAPKIKEQQAEIEHRRTVVQSLANTWGQEKFDLLASKLDDTFDGLADANGKPKPATDAIFEADDPAALIEYLTDPDNADKAEAIGRMNGIQAGRAIAKVEAEIAGKKASAKPQASKAPAPVEALRGSGGASNDRAPSDPKAYMKWANAKYGRI